MANENKVIQLGQSYDPGMENIRDVTPEAARKMYVYQLAEEEAGKGFFIPGATTLLRILNGESEFSIMEEDADEQNHFFTWALVNEDLSGYLSSTESASYLSTSLNYERQFQALVQNFNQHGKNDRFLITFDEPYDVNAYMSKEQEAFILSSGSLADSTWFEYNTNNVVNETSTVFNLQSLHTIEDSSAYTKVIPYISFSNPLEGVNDINLKLNEGTLLERVTGYSKPGDNFVPLDFRVVSFEGQLTPMKVYPTSIDNHLTCYFDWLDADITMPESLAKNFLFGGEYLYNILPEDEDFQLVSDMLLFTAGFQENFKQVARNNDGKFEPKKTIGYSRTPLSALVGQNPVEVISSLVDTYLKNYPSKKNTVAFQRITQLLAALSRYIISTYSIAGGNNSFNEFYLPWYLDSAKAFDIQEDEDNLQVKRSSLKFKLKSNWFDLSRDAIDELSDINITSPRIKQLQNKFQMPQLPTVIQSADLGKAFNPGAIDPSNPRELNYILYNIGMGDGSTRSRIASLLNTDKITIKKGTTYKVSNGEISAPAFPTAVIPYDLLKSLGKEGNVPSSRLDKISLYSQELSAPFFGQIGYTKLTWDYFIDHYIKPRIMNQLGITDASAIDVSIPNRNLSSSYKTIPSPDSEVNNAPDVRGIDYANMLDNSLLELGTSPLYNLTLADRRQLKGVSEEIFRDKDWPKIADVNNDEVGKFISDYISEPVSLEGAQGVVRYKELQPKEILVTFKKDIDINTAAKDKVLYNKSNWNRKVKTAQGVLQANLWIELDTDHADSGENIAQIKVLEIKGLFMEELYIDNTTSTFLRGLRLEAPSNTDETITVFRIAFL